MRSIRSYLKSCRGITFVELLITIIIIAILAPTIGTSIYYTMKSYTWAKDYSDMCSLVSAVDGTVLRELSLANSPNVSGGVITYSKNGSPRRLETKEVEFKGKKINILFIDDMHVFDPGVYKDVSVNASFVIEGGLVKVNIIYDGVVRHSSEFAVSKM